MPDHPGSRACYQQGCRALECRVANAVYEKQRRTRLRMTQEAGIINGAYTGKLLRKLRSEGYTQQQLGEAVGLEPRSIRRHLHSSPVRRSTFERIQQFIQRLEQYGETLDRARQQVAETMMNSLGYDHRSHADAWQDFSSHANDE